MNSEAIRFVLFILMFVVGCFVGNEGEYHRGQQVVRQQAIDAGAAHWQINSKTGEREFVFGVQEE